MANTVKVRFNRSLPGSGFDSAGNPSQGKVEVSGVIAVTSYAQAGEDLTPKDIGLGTIDWLDIKHENESGAADGTEPRAVHYNYGAQQFYITETGVSANAGTHNLRFRAVGDTAKGPALL